MKNICKGGVNKCRKQKTFNKIILNEKSVEDPLETVLVYQDGNYTTVKELNEKGKLFHAKKIFEFFSKIKCNFVYCLLINCFPFKFYFMSNL